MKISHKIKKSVVEKNSDNDEISLFLISKRGHCISLPAKSSSSISSFNGWISYKEKGDSYEMYKTIENIRLDKDSDEITNNFYNIERKSGPSSERFTIVKNGIIYEVASYQEFINISLDFRFIFDNDDKGRIYNISRSGDNLLVTYEKFYDDSLTSTAHRHYLAIRGASAYEMVGKWEKKFYPYDASRYTQSDFFIYNALRILCKNNIQLIIANGNSVEECISKINDIEKNMDVIDNVHLKYMDNVLYDKLGVSKLSNAKTGMAYANSVHAMDGVSVNLQLGSKKVSGIWAGLPWFAQFWSRDELISLKSLIIEGKFDLAKEIMMRYLREITIDGRIPNRYPHADLGSADGIGWLFKRILDLLELCEKNGNFDHYFSLYDIKYIRERLNFSIKAMLKNHSRDGLIVNNNLETWMDTSGNGDFREGARIEIQCLLLSMLKLMNTLNYYLSNKLVKKEGKLIRMTPQDMDVKEMEEDFRKIVRDKFLKSYGDKHVLNDGYEGSLSEVIRPNIFIAHYIYPELLSPKEWDSAFENALALLWCEWDIEGEKCGGLSTIDTTHALYNPHHTGMNNKSYHRGDIWFWVNNIAAIGMHKVNKEKYDSYIQKIINSSNEDVLFRGYIGYASEISGSTVFRPAGCFCQSWSMATYIELINELYVD